MAIDEHSAEFLFGRILTRLDQQQLVIKELTSQLGTVRKAIADENTYQTRAKMGLRNTMIVGMSSAAVGSVFTIITQLLTAPK